LGTRETERGFAPKGKTCQFHPLQGEGKKGEITSEIVMRAVREENGIVLSPRSRESGYNRGGEKGLPTKPRFLEGKKGKSTPLRIYSLGKKKVQFKISWAHEGPLSGRKKEKETKTFHG